MSKYLLIVPFIAVLFLYGAFIHVPSATAEEPNVYIVRAGDTLWEIAQKYGTDIQTLVAANNIENLNLINVGQRILISGAHDARYQFCKRIEAECWKDKVRAWASRYGANPDLAECIVENESKFRPYAQNPRSSAGGLWQFVDSTWIEVIDRMELNWTLADKKNGDKNAQAGAWLLAYDGHTQWEVGSQCIVVGYETTPTYPPLFYFFLHLLFSEEVP